MNEPVTALTPPQSNSSHRLPSPLPSRISLLGSLPRLYPISMNGSQESPKERNRAQSASDGYRPSPSSATDRENSWLAALSLSKKNSTGCLNKRVSRNEFGFSNVDSSHENSQRNLSPQNLKRGILIHSLRQENSGKDCASASLGASSESLGAVGTSLTENSRSDPQTHLPPLHHSHSSPMTSVQSRPQNSPFGTFSSPNHSALQPNSYSGSSIAPQINGPRSLSIRFAPLPDPRASRPLLTTPGGVSVWCSREELPDGTWGEYRMVIKRSNGEAIAIEDLKDPGERKAVLEAFEHQNISNLDSIHHPNPNEAPKQPVSKWALSPDNDQSRKVLFGASTAQAPDHSTEARLNNSLNSTGVPPAASSSGFPIYRTTSADTVSILSSSSVGNLDAFNRNTSSSSSLTKKFIDVVKKPLKGYSQRLTSTSSLPIDNNPGFGAPLTKSRSAESAKRPGWRASVNLGIRRTQSKDERPSSMISKGVSFSGFGEDRIVIPLEVERARRRAKYPPVAQRKAHMGGSRGGAGKVPIVEEPEFLEWGAPSNTALVNLVKAKNSHLSNGQPANDPKDDPLEDDGTGMAWLRKRKREREERARLEAEEKARLSSPPQVVFHPVPDESPSSFGEGDLGSNLGGLGKSYCSESSNDRNSQPSLRSEASNEVSACDRSRRSSQTTNSSQSSGCMQEDTVSNGSSGQSQSLEGATAKLTLADEDDLNEEELEEEERLQAKAMIESPFLRGAKEVFKDREHHRVLAT